MEAGDDKNWARRYLLDPLNEPDPSDETGLNTHYRSTFAPIPSEERITPPAESQIPARGPSKLVKHSHSKSESTNPFRRSSQSTKSAASATTRSRASSMTGYPTPPSSASPKQNQFPESHRDVRSIDSKGNTSGLRRGNSLSARYPGDTSHRPLDVLRHENKLANRHRHTKRQPHPGLDTIDRLDFNAIVGGSYHHDGPYDAALLSRNTNIKNSPLAAVRDTNAEALKATSPENIKDSIEKHRPLDGVAAVPPGMPDKFGRVLHYEEGTDMMRDLGGNYRRWPGVDYHPDDLKGKGEPSFTIDRALKNHKNHGEEGQELQTRHRSRNKSISHADDVNVPQREYSDINRSNTTGRKVGEGMKKRFGSLRRKKQEQQVN